MPKSVSYDSYLIELLKDPQQAEAYLKAALEEGDAELIKMAEINITEAGNGDICRKLLNSPDQSTLTSKLLKVLVNSNGQTNDRTSNVGFLLLTLKESNSSNRSQNYFSRLFRCLKIMSIVDPWNWISKLPKLKKIHNTGRNFGLLKWVEEEKFNDTIVVKFCILIMVDSEYFTSEEYKNVFESGKKDENGFFLEKASQDSTKLFLLPLRVSCKRLPVRSFSGKLIEEILETVGYLPQADSRRDLKRVKIYDIIPVWNFRDYQKFSISTFPDTLKDSLQITLFILAIAGLTIPGIDVASKLSSLVSTKEFSHKDLEEVTRVSQYFSLFILYITLAGLVVFLAIVTTTLLRERRSNAISTLTGVLSLYILLVLFSLFIYVTSFFIFKFKPSNCAQITGITDFLFFCLYLFFLWVKKDAQFLRFLLSMFRFAIAWLSNIKSR